MKKAPQRSWLAFNRAGRKLADVAPSNIAFQNIKASLISSNTCARACARIVRLAQVSQALSPFVPDADGTRNRTTHTNGTDGRLTEKSSELRAPDSQILDRHGVSFSA